MNPAEDRWQLRKLRKKLREGGLSPYNPQVAILRSSWTSRPGAGSEAISNLGLRIPFLRRRWRGASVSASSAVVLPPPGIIAFEPGGIAVLVTLALPIGLSAVALFFASFLSWMVLQLHKNDWRKLEHEDELMAAAARCQIADGSYMFPACSSQEAQSEAYKQKYETGPRGVLTILPKVNMGKNLALTFVYFLVVSFCFGYLASIAFRPGADFISVFRLVFMAGLLTFLAAMVQHAIWFRPRIVGHVIESVAYAAITAAIFASLWPAA
jgi:hypothetical protein